MYKQGVFETMRVYKGCVFAAKLHIMRMLGGCEALRIKLPDQDLLELAINTIIKERNIKSGRIRLRVVKTVEGSQIIVSSQKLPLSADRVRAFRVYLDKGRNFKPALSGTVKSLDRTFYERMFSRAKKMDYDEAVFCNTRGNIVEGTRSNIFAIRQGRVFTPSLSSGCLAGITRAVVISILKKAGIPCIEKPITPGELVSADEIFLTNSIIEVVPVARVNKIPVGNGQRGALTEKIINLYKKEVVKQCGLR